MYLISTPRILYYVNKKLSFVYPEVAKMKKKLIRDPRNFPEPTRYRFSFRLAKKMKKST